MTRCDIAVVGGGIAGAALAAELAPHATVTILESESLAGYHATGRSAAFWSETYGGPAIQPLTTASYDGLAPFLAPLGSLKLGRAEDAAAIDTFLAQFADSGVVLERCDPSTRLPGLRDEWVLGVWEPSCAYIDVAAVHADALARARRAGAELWVDAGLRGARRTGGGWQLETARGPLAASILVDAAGAWADAVAELAGAGPLGIQPFRRTMVQLVTDPPPPVGLSHVSHIRGSFYFKPEPGGRLWLSPHDETLVVPHDVQPEELDVAIAIDRFEHVVDWRVARVERRWAGLRSFAPDRLPVYGFAPGAPGFFWCAGQGGFGIQTAPAASRLAADLILGRAPAIDPAPYAPDRFTGVT